MTNKISASGTVTHPDASNNYNLTRLEILDMLQSRKCVCGSDKSTMRSHCSYCFHQLPPEAGRALYRKFGNGYEAAFIESLTILIELGRTNVETIRAAVPEPKDKN